MGERDRNLASILAQCDEGRISPAVALMQMLIETEDEASVAETLAASESRTARSIEDLQRANAAGCARVASMLRSDVDSSRSHGSVEEGIAFCKRLFDWSVGQSEEASVALYSLGSPALLQAATDEIVEVFASWGSLGVHKSALDVGCGIGRMELALAPELATMHAIDVSDAMVAVARRRCAALENVVVSPCSGLDLGDFGDGAFDLVFSVDAFPYLVQSGMPLVRAHFAEVARVLRDGGEFIVLDFSYRDDLRADREDVAELAAAFGFQVLVDGETPFSVWNGAAFRMRRSRR